MRPANGESSLACFRTETTRACEEEGGHLVLCKHRVWCVFALCSQSTAITPSHPSPPRTHSLQTRNRRLTAGSRPLWVPKVSSIMGPQGWIRAGRAKPLVGPHTLLLLRFKINANNKHCFIDWLKDSDTGKPAVGGVWQLLLTDCPQSESQRAQLDSRSHGDCRPRTRTPVGHTLPRTSHYRAP